MPTALPTTNPVRLQDYRPNARTIYRYSKSCEAISFFHEITATPQNQSQHHRGLTLRLLRLPRLEWDETRVHESIRPRKFVMRIKADN